MQRALFCGCLIKYWHAMRFNELPVFKIVIFTYFMIIDSPPFFDAMFMQVKRTRNLLNFNLLNFTLRT